MTDLTIIVPPAGFNNTVYPPYGALSIASALRSRGMTPSIINVDTDRMDDGTLIERLRQDNPRAIGLSGIVAPSYRYFKTLSRRIKETFPQTPLILGGGLASATEPVMANMPIDIIVHSEGDETIVELMQRLKNGGTLENVAGITFRDGTRTRSTGKRPLIMQLDSLPLPAFDLIDIGRYMPDGIEFMRRFRRSFRDKRLFALRSRPRMMTIPTSRGCFGACTFCFRAYRGIRFNSMRYVFDFIEHCSERFGAGFFTLGDECFAANKERNWQFIEEYKRRKHSFLFRILGMRVDTVDREVLKAYRDIGCWMIEYGFESGSQRMLNIIDKRVSVEQNRQVARWTAEADIYTSPTLVLGMPGETQETVRESIEFLKSLDLGYKQYQWSYALPIPGSQLYEFCRLTGIIGDEDEYLTSLHGPVGNAGLPHVNMTDESDEVLAGWADLVKDEIDNRFFLRRYRFGFLARIMRLAHTLLLHLRKNDLGTVLRAKLTGAGKQAAEIATPRKSGYGKRSNLSINKLFAGLDSGSINRELSLERINQKLRETSAPSIVK